MAYSKEQQSFFKAETDRLLLLADRLFIPENAAEIVERLSKALRYHDWRYYVLAEPQISDFEYDKLFGLLKRIEEAHPELVKSDSPTKRVAYGLTEQFQTVEHNVPMLSLDNSYNESDLRDWDKRVRGFLAGELPEYCIEPKFDGASIALVFENNQLVRAATRGDGVSGDDITLNVKAMRSVPLSADFDKKGIKKAELRGEALVSKSNFIQQNQKRAEEGLAVFANPRNYSSGALRMKSSKEVAGKNLEVFVYQIGFYEQLGPVIPFKTHRQSLSLLDDLGFRTPAEEVKICQNIEEVIGWCRTWEEKRNNYPYEIDGLVIKLNNLSQQEKCGYTSHHPRWAIAFKFKAQQAESILKTVEFQVGRTGAITPVAKIDPIPLAGVTISSISLFNEDVVREKDLHLGDTVLVERAGDVIPYIVRAFPEKRNENTKPIRFPSKCPACSSLLVRAEGEAAWRCVNLDCPAQVVERLIHFAGRDAMDIRGLGDKIVHRFFELGFLKGIEDIYELPYDSIEDLDGFGVRSAQKLLESVEDSKNQPLEKLLFALGIRFVGQSTAKTLVSVVEDIRDLKNFSIEKLMQLEDVGPKVAASIHEFFTRKENLQLLDRLADFGVNLKSERKNQTGDSTGELSGKTFLFTGTLSKMKRSEAEKLVEDKGGEILGSVSAKLQFLVVGESPGSKVDKAKKLGTVTIIDEETFLQMVDSIQS